jgi:hypothetical protein
MPLIEQAICVHHLSTNSQSHLYQDNLQAQLGFLKKKKKIRQNGCSNRQILQAFNTAGSVKPHSGIQRQWIFLSSISITFNHINTVLTKNTRIVDLLPRKISSFPQPV